MLVYFLKLYRNFVKEKVFFNITIIYNATNIIIAYIFFLLLPSILNYPPNFIEVSNLKLIPYSVQFILITFLASSFGTLFLFVVFKDINRWEYKTKVDKDLDISKLLLIKKKCHNLPYYIYFIQIIFPLSAVTLVFLLIGNIPLTIILKVNLVVLISTTFGAVISFIFSKKCFRKILINIHTDNTFDGIRFSIIQKTIFLGIPIFVAALIFTSFVGYSRLINEKGFWIFQTYKAQLQKEFSEVTNIENIDSIFNRLKKVNLKDVNGSHFLITPSGKLKISGNINMDYYLKLSVFNFSSKYKGRIYGATAETQGVAFKINCIGENCFIGVIYNVVSNETIIWFIISFLFLLIIITFFLFYYSKDLVEDVSLVTQNLSMIAERKTINYNNRIPLTSNDEIGDLIVSFNKILDLEKENISIARELAVVKERNRFSRDVHDTMGQTITNLVAFLGMVHLYLRLSPDKAEIYLDKATQTAKVGLTEVKKALSGLSTENATIDSLLKNIKLLITNYQSNELSVEFNISETDSNIGIQISDVIYRVCQEAMTNAVNHGKAHKIKIDLDFVTEKILLSISDNGIGCQKIKKGNGLFGMEERVKELKGSIVFDYNYQGFGIKVCLPYLIS